MLGLLIAAFVGGVVFCWYCKDWIKLQVNGAKAEVASLEAKVASLKAKI